MSITTTYTAARANLARLCAHAADNCESVVIQRRGHKDVALVSADELRSLTETAHLLRSPRNRDRLLRALRRAQRKTGRPKTISQLRREVGLGQD